MSDVPSSSLFMKLGSLTSIKRREEKLSLGKWEGAGVLQDSWASLFLADIGFELLNIRIYAWIVKHHLYTWKKMDLRMCLNIFSSWLGGLATMTGRVTNYAVGYESLIFKIILPYPKMTSIDSHLLVIMPLCNLLHLRVDTICNLLLTNR